MKFFRFHVGNSSLGGGMGGAGGPVEWAGVSVLESDSEPEDSDSTSSLDD